MERRQRIIVLEGFLLPLTAQSSGASVLSACLNTLEMKYSYMLVFVVANSFASNSNYWRENVIIIKAFAHMPTAVWILMHCALPSTCECHLFNFGWWEHRSVNPNTGIHRAGVRAVQWCGGGCSSQQFPAPRGFPDLAWQGLFSPVLAVSAAELCKFLLMYAVL